MKSPFDGNIDKTSGDFQLRISLENCFAHAGDGVMRVLVIPDIHLKTWIFDRTKKIIKDGKAGHPAFDKGAYEWDRSKWK